MTDWNQKGRKAAQSYLDGSGYAAYGQFVLTYLRAALRLTDTSAQWLACKDGFYERLREYNKTGIA